MSPYFLLSLLPLLSLTIARQVTVQNSCGTTIWPGLYTGSGTVPTQATGWELTSGNSTSFEVAEDWTAGRIWARTGCTVQDGSFLCLTGSCGDGTDGDLTCSTTGSPPATLAEFTMSADAEDNFDISLVDGFNIPVDIIPSVSSCPQPQCQGNINALCPALLRTSLDENGVNLGCLAPCNAGFGEEEYGNRACCTGAYANSTLCQSCGVDYYSLFKENCNTSYAYPYDEKSETALWTCSGAPDYTIEFCPGGTDYVGAKTPSTEYDDATATCSSLATTYDQTFTVGPSPTSTATMGTLSVVATAATGVDGAAAIEIDTSTTSAATGASADSSDIATSTTAAIVSSDVATTSAVATSAAATSAAAVVSTTDETSAAAVTSTTEAVSDDVGTSTAVSAVNVESTSAADDTAADLVTSTTVVTTTLASTASAVGADNLAEDVSAVSTSTVIVTEFVTVDGTAPSPDTSSSAAVTAAESTRTDADIAAVAVTSSTASAEGSDVTSVFTVFGGSTLVEVVNARNTQTATSSDDHALAVETSQSGSGSAIAASQSSVNEKSYLSLSSAAPSLVSSAGSSAVSASAHSQRKKKRNLGQVGH